MNAVEHIVDCYFRLCRRCFTMNDVKVVDGNNRQLDLLAINLLDGSQYHVESAVTHSWEWFTNPQELTQELNRKFFGIPAPKEGKNTDFTKGKTYTLQINKMYQNLGLDPDRLQRVYVTWAIPGFANVNEAVVEYSRARNVRPIEVLSFRDTILPALEQEVGTSNYEDEVLRTLSLLRQRQLHLMQPAPSSLSGS
ncbi:MAG: hypothetical protein Q8K78_17705 [Planctomycetaceae bacterium]|nr:hypothetical protein [Planctomycetaceae bacterium]